MNEVVSDLSCNDQGIFIGVVHLACIGLGKDNVVWWWCITHQGLGTGGTYHILRWFLGLLRVYVSRVSAILDFTRSPEYHHELSSFRCMADIFP